MRWCISFLTPLQSLVCRHPAYYEGRILSLRFWYSGKRPQLCPKQIDAHLERIGITNIPQMLTVLHLSFVQRGIGHRQLRSSVFTPDTVPISTLFQTRAIHRIDEPRHCQVSGPLSTSPYYCIITERRPFPGPEWFSEVRQGKVRSF